MEVVIACIHAGEVALGYLDFLFARLAVYVLAHVEVTVGGPPGLGELRDL